jgi:hypothetical protein
MKKFTLLFALLVMTVCGFANATPGNPEEASFKKDFPTATDASWERSQSLYKVNFSMGTQSLSAYYAGSGELVSVVRHISSEQLPLGLLINLKNHYKDYWISDLFELSSNEQHEYYLTVEDGNKQVILKSFDNKTWNLFKKTVKL